MEITSHLPCSHIHCPLCMPWPTTWPQSLDSALLLRDPLTVHRIMLQPSSNATLTLLAAFQAEMSDKNPSGWGDTSELALLFAGFKEMIGLISELKLHKRSIWPLLNYAQRQTLLLEVEFRLFVWGDDSVGPGNHEVLYFILTPRFVPQGVMVILELANGCKNCWKAGTVRWLSVGEYMVHDPRLRCGTR